MNKRVKQLTAVVLVVCALLTMTVPMAFAAEETTVYDFNVVDNYSSDIAVSAYQWAKKSLKNWAYDTNGNKLDVLYTELTATLYADNNCSLNWMYEDGTEAMQGSTFRANEGIRMSASTVGDWIAFRLAAPDGGAGRYNASVTLANKKETVDIYLLNYTDGMNIEGSLKDDNKVFSSLNTAGTYTTNNTVPLTAGECVLVLKFTEINDSYNIGLLNFTLTPVAEDYVASVGGTNYADAASAIAAIASAGASDEVKITGNLQLTETLNTAAAITVSEGAVLDLNGNALSAEAVTCTGTGVVKDSQDGLGTMTVDNKNLNTDGQLALKDGGAYRFFNVTVEELGITNKVMNGEALSSGKFWFRVSFTNEAAYALANGQMIIGANLTGTGVPEDTNAWATAEFTTAWVKAVSDNTASDICFTAKNLDSVSDFKLTPVVKANDVTVSGDAL